MSAGSPADPLAAGGQPGPVQLIIWRGDALAVGQLCAEELIAFQDHDQAMVYEAARAWAQVRGYERLIDPIDDMLGGTPPKSGFTILINKPYRLTLLARWTWAPPAVLAM